MNLFELQERLKDFSQDQLVREMQAPTGMAPQFLVLSELQRRQRMMAESQAQMPQDQTTVAQDAVAAAGVPQGGLADMAQAMAPRTDMDMNTGVAPVERMRDGGVVRMQLGGMLGDPLAPYAQHLNQTYTTPKIENFVEGVRNMERETFGEQAPGMRRAATQLPFGQPPSQVGALMRQQPAPPLELNAADPYDGMRGFGVMMDNPLQVQQPQYGVSRNISGGQGFVPMQPQTGSMQQIGSPFDIGSIFAARRMADGGVVRMQPGGLAGISRDLDVYSPTMEGARLIPERMMEEEDARRRRAELAAAMFQYESGRMPVPTGEGQLFDFDTSPLLPQEIAPEAGAPPVGTDLRGLGTVVQEFISGEDPEAAATRLLENGLIDEEQYNRYVFGSSGERERVAREALDLDPRREFPAPADVTDTEEAATAEEVVNLPELVIDSEPGLSFGDQFPPVDVRRASDEVLGFGDITPTGAEIPLALPRGAEEKEPPAPRTGGGGGAAAPAGDDAFNQDKWLALAQAGLSLMSSQQPTLGGAIGEAGLSGITALRTARGERDERVAAQQARADRLAAAARTDRDRETYPYRQVDDIIGMADSYAQAAQAIVEANFNTPPAEGDPGYDSYISNLAMANVLRRRALALTGQE